MPLLDDLGLAPYVAPDRARREAERQQLTDLLSPLTQPQTSSQGKVAQNAVVSDAIRQALSAGQAATQQQNIQNALGLATQTVFGKLLGGAPTQPAIQPVPNQVAIAPSLSSVIGKRNYLTGRGDQAIRSLAQGVAQRMGWGADQFTAWDALINAESGWRPTAQNPTSTAYGLGQFLNSTWGPYGAKTSDPGAQLDYMARYIKNRYGDPVQALLFHSKKNYY